MTDRQEEMIAVLIGLESVRSSAHFGFDHRRHQESSTGIGASVHGHQHGAVTATKEARTLTRYGFRGTRAGEASNPGSPQSRRLRRKSHSRTGQSPIDVSSDEEPLSQHGHGRVAQSTRGVTVPFVVMEMLKLRQLLQFR